MATEAYVLSKEDVALLKKLISQLKIGAKPLPVPPGSSKDPLANDFYIALRSVGDDETPDGMTDMESSKCNIMSPTPTDDWDYADLVGSQALYEHYVYMPVGSDLKNSEDSNEANAYIPVIRTKHGLWVGICMVDDGTTQEEILSTAVGTVLLRDSPTSHTVEVYNPYATTIPINVSVTIGLNTRKGQWIILGADCAT